MILAARAWHTERFNGGGCQETWFQSVADARAQGGGHPGMMNGMYGMGAPQQNGLVPGHAARALEEPPPAKRFKPAQQARPSSSEACRPYPNP